jgi:dTDP-glucose 4,6-dehydratase
MEFNKIVITGAAGFIGSHVYDHFSSIFPDAKISILDKMTYAGNIKNIPTILTNNNHKFVVGDLTDLEVCLKTTQNTDLVINLAAESHVDNSFSNSIIFSKSNELGTHTLMEACRQNQVKKIIHVSTDEVYGENIKDLFTEEDRLNPTNPYSASKAAAEMIVKSYFTSFNLPVIVVRANNIYGIRQFPEKIIPKFILRCLNNLNLEIHGDGSNQRHYLAANDFALALEMLCQKGQLGEAYNIASDIELTNIEVANLIKGYFPKSTNTIEFVTNRPFNDSRYAVDDSKLRNLGWKPKKSLTKDLPEIIEWYTANSNWFK